MYRIDPSIFPKFESKTLGVNNLFDILVPSVYPIQILLIPTRDIEVISFLHFEK
jgi:hypothetical protein